MLPIMDCEVGVGRQVVLILGETDPEIIKKMLVNVMVPEFSPQRGVKIQVQENENIQHNTDEVSALFPSKPTRFPSFFCYSG